MENVDFDPVGINAYNNRVNVTQYQCLSMFRPGLIRYFV